MSDNFDQQCLTAFSKAVPATFLAFYRVDDQFQAHDFQLLAPVLRQRRSSYPQRDAPH
ncbi:hypothetical protein SA496_05295 [Pseudomonas sp. JS3066]|jgi:hypothetical protein|uniref:hypothetical protein n=1 Tax=unclassified Pseudomonas TaxID=196821 RepID=UPI00129E1D74|nr:MULTISPECIES: hypothetical protein [unclassified Pseudomonas]WVK94604.1 hypothetical protein SA496_05295 [Pseudomonas sp. JS3066]